MLIYISGPYSGQDTEAVSANIAAARAAAVRIWESGNYAICPHLNTAHFEKSCDVAYEQYLAGDLDILMRCDAILMLSKWEASNGAKIELEHARAHGIPEYYWPDMPQRHPTEARCPEQSKAFLQTVMAMYRTHLSKNHDYSPANVLGTGSIGLVTRIWDKVARLMNLTGFRLEMSAPADYVAPREPKHESIDDTLLDLAVYGVIGLLLRRGVWGK